MNPNTSSQTRRDFLRTCGAATLATLAARLPAWAAATGLKPNLALIVSDDMGYADLPRFGADMEIPMPNIERLAAGGTVLTDAYVSGPICVPSRMGMVTGRHQARCGVYTNVYGGAPFDAFNQENTLAEFLKAAGYATSLVGKWHLCGNGRQLYGILPDKRGYDEVVIIPGGMSSFWPGVDLCRDGGRAEKAPEYLTDFFGKEAAAFIHRQKDQPFFLHLAFNAVHAPLHAEDEDIAAVGDLTGYDRARYTPSLKHADREPKMDRQVYAGMMRAMDRNIGRVLDALEAAGAAENTLVMFVNDNGGPALDAAAHSRNMASNAPLRGHKFDVYEGGVRVPMIVRWPGQVPAGKTFAGISSALDIAPTFLTAAGGALPTEKPMDGVNLVPFLAGRKPGNPHDELCWQIYFGDAKKAQAGIRRGSWKLVQVCRLDAGPAANQWELYDLATDIGEQENLASQHPERVQDLDAAWRKWRAQMKDAEMPPPRKATGEKEKKE